jgi:hypothetical protein
VLTERRYRPHDRLLPGCLDGREQGVDFSPGRPDRAPAATGAQFRVLGQFVGRPEPGAGDPGCLERLDDLISRLFRESVLDDRGQLVVARRPVRVAREPGVRCQVTPLQHVVAENEPLPVVLNPEKDRAVAGAERAVRGDGRMPCPGPRKWLPTVVREVDGLSHPLAERIDHGNVQGRAHPGVLPVVQGSQDAGVGIHAGGDVGDGDAGPRRALRCTGRHH